MLVEVDMKRLISWPHFFLASAIVIAFAWALNGGFGNGFWITFVIVTVAVLVNGVIIAFEDD